MLKTKVWKPFTLSKYRQFQLDLVKVKQSPSWNTHPNTPWSSLYSLLSNRLDHWNTNRLLREARQLGISGLTGRSSTATGGKAFLIHAVVHRLMLVGAYGWLTKDPRVTAVTIDVGKLNMAVMVGSWSSVWDPHPRSGLTIHRWNLHDLATLPTTSYPFDTRGESIPPTVLGLSTPIDYARQLRTLLQTLFTEPPFCPSPSSPSTFPGAHPSWNPLPPTTSPFLCAIEQQMKQHNPSCTVMEAILHAYLYPRTLSISPLSMASYFELQKPEFDAALYQSLVTTASSESPVPLDSKAASKKKETVRRRRDPRQPTKDVKEPGKKWLTTLLVDTFLEESAKGGSETLLTWSDASTLNAWRTAVKKDDLADAMVMQLMMFLWYHRSARLLHHLLYEFE